MSDISGEALAIFAAVIAVIFAEQFDEDDLNTLSCLFSAISDNICIITSQRAAIEKSLNKTMDKS